MSVHIQFLKAERHPSVKLQRHKHAFARRIAASQNDLRRDYQPAVTGASIHAPSRLSPYYRMASRRFTFVATLGTNEHNHDPLSILGPVSPPVPLPREWTIWFYLPDLIFNGGSRPGLISTLSIFLLSIISILVVSCRVSCCYSAHRHSG